MGWCYTFGVDCHTGCKHPMLVRDSLDGCECAECGTLCAGRFENCWRSVFQPNGRVLQLRCIPPNLASVIAAGEEVSAVAIAEPGAAGVAEIDSLGQFEVNAESVGGNGNGNGHGPKPDSDELADLRGQIDQLRNEIARLTADVAAIAHREGIRESELSAITEQVETISIAVPAIAPIKARASDRQIDQHRPGRAVAHPETIAIQDRHREATGLP